MLCFLLFLSLSVDFLCQQYIFFLFFFFPKWTEHRTPRLGFFFYSVVMTAGEPRVEEAC